VCPVSVRRIGPAFGFATVREFADSRRFDAGGLTVEILSSRSSGCASHSKGSSTFFFSWGGGRPARHGRSQGRTVGEARRATMQHCVRSSPRCARTLTPRHSTATRVSFRPPTTYEQPLGLSLGTVQLGDRYLRCCGARGLRRSLMGTTPIPGKAQRGSTDGSSVSSSTPGPSGGRCYAVTRDGAERELAVGSCGTAERVSTRAPMCTVVHLRATYARPTPSSREP
jgi:hypothetical protein